MHSCATTVAKKGINFFLECISWKNSVTVVQHNCFYHLDVWIEVLIVLSNCCNHTSNILTLAQSTMERDLFYWEYFSLWDSMLLLFSISYIIRGYNSFTRGIDLFKCLLGNCIAFLLMMVSPRDNNRIQTQWVS